MFAISVEFCSNLGNSLPNFAELDRSRPDVGQTCPGLVQIWPKPAHMWPDSLQVWSIWVHWCSKSAQLWPNSVKIRQRWPHLGQFWSEFDGNRKMLHDSGLNLSEIVPSSGELGQFWPNRERLTESGPNTAVIGLGSAEIAQVWPNFGQSCREGWSEFDRDRLKPKVAACRRRPGICLGGRLAVLHCSRSSGRHVWALCHQSLGRRFATLSSLGVADDMPPPSVGPLPHAARGLR